MAARRRLAAGPARARFRMPSEYSRTLQPAGTMPRVFCKTLSLVDWARSESRAGSRRPGSARCWVWHSRRSAGMSGIRAAFRCGSSSGSRERSHDRRRGGPRKPNERRWPSVAVPRHRHRCYDKNDRPPLPGARTSPPDARAAPEPRRPGWGTRCHTRHGLPRRCARVHGPDSQVANRGDVRSYPLALNRETHGTSDHRVPLRGRLARGSPYHGGMAGARGIRTKNGSSFRGRDGARPRVAFCPGADRY